MELDFWLQKWEEKQIGFHQSVYNPKMVEFFSNYDLNNKQVFVPLCGKSLDMIWLAKQGAKVVGVEISPIAVKEFFAENDIPYEIEKKSEREWYRSNGVDILLGDFFNLEIQSFDFIYDRAAMVALPPGLRKSYQDRMCLLAKNSNYFLFTFEYDEQKFQGPPFSVSEFEVMNAFKNNNVKKVFEVSEKGDFRDTKLMVKRVVYHITEGK